jgi:hypothetical protein
MKTNKLLLAATMLGAFALAGCPTDPVPATDAGRDTGGGGDDTGVLPEDGGGDAFTPPVDSGPVSITCAYYCGLVTTNCTDEFAQYNDMADCMSYCDAAGWDVGVEADTEGPTLGCHIYHAGVPAAGAPEVHCDHAGPSGGGVCGSADFRTETTGYARVDRMGMPAVATALVSSARKNAYNDGNPSAMPGGDQDTTTGPMPGLPFWAPEFATELVGIHAALNDDLIGLGLTQCGMVAPTMFTDVLPCALQTLTPTSTTRVLDLVVPDTLRIDTTMPSGFPNGRLLADPVIDVTLAVVLLDLTVHNPGTLAAVPLNPPANDIAEGVFLTTFPYVHPPHAP